MNRNLTEIVKSQQKMLGKDTDALPLRLFESYKKQLSLVETWKNKEPGVELIYIDYKDALNNTKAVVDKVISFIDVSMDAKQMRQCVDKTLYKNKV